MGIPIASPGDTVLALFLLAVLVLGYVVLWAIWHFGFKGHGHDHEADGDA